MNYIFDYIYLENLKNIFDFNIHTQSKTNNNKKNTLLLKQKIKKNKVSALNKDNIQKNLINDLSKQIANIQVLDKKNQKIYANKIKKEFNRHFFNSILTDTVKENMLNNLEIVNEFLESIDDNTIKTEIISIILTDITLCSNGFYNRTLDAVKLISYKDNNNIIDVIKNQIDNLIKQLSTDIKSGFNTRQTIHVYAFLCNISHEILGENLTNNFSEDRHANVGITRIEKYEGKISLVKHLKKHFSPQHVISLIISSLCEQIGDSNKILYSQEKYDFWKQNINNFFDPLILNFSQENIDIFEFDESYKNMSINKIILADKLIKVLEEKKLFAHFNNINNQFVPGKSFISKINQNLKITLPCIKKITVDKGLLSLKDFSAKIKITYKNTVQDKATKYFCYLENIDLIDNISQELKDSIKSEFYNDFLMKMYYIKYNQLYVIHQNMYLRLYTDYISIAKYSKLHINHILSVCNFSARKILQQTMFRDFSDLDLQDINFEQIDNLSGIQFNNSILKDASFCDSDLTKVDFSKAINAGLIKINEHTILKKTKFKPDDLLSLYNSYANNEEIIDSLKNQIDLSGQKISLKNINDLIKKGHNNFVGIDFSNVEFSEETFDSLNLSNSNFKKAKFYNCIFINCDLDKCNFENADFRFSKFEQKSSLRNALFINTNLQYSKFFVDSMRGARFKGSDLSFANFIGCNIKQANFKEVKSLKEALFLKVDYAGTKFSSCCLVERKCVFASIDTKPVDQFFTICSICDSRLENIDQAQRAHPENIEGIALITMICMIPAVSICLTAITCSTPFFLTKKLCIPNREWEDKKNKAFAKFKQDQFFPTTNFIIR